MLPGDLCVRYKSTEPQSSPSKREAPNPAAELRRPTVTGVRFDALMSQLGS